MCRLHPFVAWNLVLLRNLFSPTLEGEQVFLALGPTELDDLAPELGGYRGLLSVVREGPPWLARGQRGENNLAGWAQGLRYQRRAIGNRPQAYVDPGSLLGYGNETDCFPAYLPILAALVAICADDHEGFYKRVQEELDSDFTQDDLEQINELFDDLDAWTVALGGRVGLCTPFVLGHHRHVGRLYAHGVFRRRDLEELARIFHALEFQPGQILNVNQQEDLLRAVENGSRLSVNLKRAARLPTYRNTILDRLRLFLEEWDGEVPESGERTAESSAPPGFGTREARISLQLTKGRLPWREGLCVTSKGGDHGVEIRYGELEWSVTLSGNGVAVAVPSGEGAGSILEAAQPSGVCLQTTEGQTLDLPHRILRVFFNDPRERCLVEREGLPGFGEAYLLVSSDNHNFPHFKSQHGKHLTVCQTDGLPAGWGLYYVSNCEALAGASLPDGRERAPATRFLKLEGGVRILRGGRWQFLGYDLPKLVVDGPPEVEVSAPGLTLTSDIDEAVDEVPFDVDGVIPGSATSGIRRYRIEVASPGQSNFQLEAIHRGGRHTVQLRLANDDSPANSSESVIGMDSRGLSTRRPPFLSGVTIVGGDDFPQPGSTTKVPDSHFGNTWSNWRWIQDLAEVRFLDTLARSGSPALPYGRARDRMGRYLRSEGRLVRASRVFLELARRGHLELVSDARGRWSSVARVAPTIYRLPVDTQEGQKVRGVAGTLRRKDWEILYTLGRERYAESLPGLKLPIIRLFGRVDEVAPFSKVENPSLAIAKYSSTLAEFRDLPTPGYEQLHPNARDVEYLNPHDGKRRWSPLNEDRDLEGCPFRLDRYTDPDTEVHKLHRLRTGSKRSLPIRYHPLNDQRWATWVVYDAMASAMARVHPDIHPWPLHYDAQARSLWLPARMRLPIVLERALVTSSGGSPRPYLLVRESVPDAPHFFGRSDFGFEIGPLHICYDQLLPVGQKRCWLEYRWVPAALASEVAKRLGCSLRSDVRMSHS